ncbi:zinc finger protein 423-like [Plodia interpunctella]|uniref:zinc finger protein 423-like n=1 Tax=Plodia interpunctella TaxID=58824 RepID=UPI002367490E|nr:zinc finger protein 423-like [Plodia interpunctella]
MSMFRSYRDVERAPSKINHKHFAAISYNCDICAEGGWISETEIEIHKKTKHLSHITDIIKDKKKFPCTVCAKAHPNKEALYQHIKSTHLLSSNNAERIEREIFICDHCCRLFFNKSLLEVHMVRKHPRKVSENWKVKCPKCYKMLKRTSLWGHLEHHHISSVATCPICLEKCMNRTDLCNHLKKHRKYYDCGVCQFSTRVEDTFRKHLKSHRDSASSIDVKLDKYFVPKYKTNIVTIYSTPSVMKGFSLMNNLHICIICRHLCVNKAEMKYHLAYDHTTIKEEARKEYKCRCGEVFFNKILLKQHVFKEKVGHCYVEERNEEEEMETTIAKPIDEQESESDSDETISVITVDPLSVI